MLKKIWQWISDLFDAVLAARFSVVMVLTSVLALALVPQGQDILRRLVEWDPNSPGSRFLTLTILLVASILWAASAWYSARIILSIRSFFGRRGTLRHRARHRDAIRTWLPRALGTAALLGVSLAFFLVGRGYGEFEKPQPADRLLKLSGIYLGLAIIFFVLVTIRRGIVRTASARLGWSQAVGQVRTASHTRPRFSKTTRALFWFFSGLSLLFVVLFSTGRAVAIATFFGSVPILLTSAAALIFFGTGLLYLGRRIGVPLLSILTLWVLVASLSNDNHAVRTIDDGSAVGGLEDRRHDLAERFRDWYQPISGQPVFLAAAEGGGIRAGYWTALVLAALEDGNPHFSRHLFAVSGVSGGSLGAAVFAALVAEDARRQGLPCGDYVDCAREMLKGDFLSPTLGIMLVPDLFQAFIPVGIPCFDRSRGFEEGWEIAWRQAVATDDPPGKPPADARRGRFAEPFLALWSGADREVPSLLMNATHVETGRRLVTTDLLPNIAASDAAGGSRRLFRDAYDLHEILTRDVPLSAAVHNSARFTYVSPAGTLRRGGEAKARVVDGGYFENSGAETLGELRKSLLEVCGRAEWCDAAAFEANLHVLLIANDPATALISRRHYEEPQLDAGPDQGLAEALSPVRALLRTRAARGSHAVSTLRAEAGAGRFHELLICGRKNRREGLDSSKKLPLPLGWLLSDLARQSMDEQLVQGFACADEVQPVADIVARVGELLTPVLPQNPSGIGN